MEKHLLDELINHQIREVPFQKRLKYKDLTRIVKYIDSSIFDEENCALWKGYITNINNSYKGLYINFYFRKKKIALHRLLYANFKGHIDDDEYIKFSCPNKGKCCNINHMIKFRYYVPTLVPENKKKAPSVKSTSDDDMTLTFA